MITGKEKEERNVNGNMEATKDNWWTNKCIRTHTHTESGLKRDWNVKKYRNVKTISQSTQTVKSSHTHIQSIRRQKFSYKVVKKRIPVHKQSRTVQECFLTKHSSV